jgi:cell division protein ZapE
MLDETRISRALTARCITPDPRQREAISALVALLGAQQRARHAWSTAAFGEP